MATAANFAVLRDSSTILDEHVYFEISSRINRDRKAVLSFMLFLNTTDDTDLSIKINGTKVWNWHTDDDINYRFYQEVIPEGLLHGGTNSLTFHNVHDSQYIVIGFSDIVIWYRVDL